VSIDLPVKVPINPRNKFKKLLNSEQCYYEINVLATFVRQPCML